VQDAVPDRLYGPQARHRRGDVIGVDLSAVSAQLLRSDAELAVEHAELQAARAGVYD